MKHAALVLLLSTLLITACGKPRHRDANNPVVPPPINPSEEDPIDWSKVQAQVLLFGAPTCQNCAAAFPKINQQLSALPAQQRAKIALKLYVEYGVSYRDPATWDIARAYRKQDGLRCPLFLDGYDVKHKRATYQKMLELTEDAFQGNNQEPSIPVAVVLDKDGNFFDPTNKNGDIFLPGNGFIPQNIVGRILTHLTERQ